MGPQTQVEWNGVLSVKNSPPYLHLEGSGFPTCKWILSAQDHPLTSTLGVSLAFCRSPEPIWAPHERAWANGFHFHSIRPLINLFLPLPHIARLCTVRPCYNGPRCNGNLIPDALQSQWRSHFALTDTLCMTDRKSFSIVGDTLMGSV